MNLNKVKTNFERLFDKNLTDLVRGIRNNKNNEVKYIAQCIEEIKEELRIPNPNIKSNAVAKLTYLQMLGYDISWAAFNIIEVMSSDRFTHKRIGYLAASQCFSINTDVLMLTINMIRRDLCSRNMYDAGCAMSGLGCFVSNEIGRELFNDVLKLLSSTKPYLRKKAVLLMYKILLVFPDTLSEVLPKLEEKLEDPDQGVQSSAVNVICELARKNPRDYLHLEGTFYKLMENSSNNWMLIKIIKLFGALTPLEPRIGEKLIEPLVNLVHSTSAMSVLYECISTIMAVLISLTSSMPKARASGHRQLCAQKLRVLIEDSDQNLKYLGLLAMRKILQTHPKSVRAHQDIILTCLEDKDESIRLRALDLLYGMVSKENLTTSDANGIVDRLMKHVSSSQMGNKFRDEIVLKVVDICSRNDYFYIKNFDWYITVLVTLASIEGGTSHGDLIAQQLLDVAVRVEQVRPYATKQMAAILSHTDKFLSNFSVTEVLYAASWICGEYSEFLIDKSATMFNLLEAMSFAPYIIAVFVQNACKIFSRIARDKPEDFETSICNRLKQTELPRLYLIDDLEVQERVANFYTIVDLVLDENIDFSKMFYAYPLNPVAPQAQLRVPIPANLDLDKPFFDKNDNSENKNSSDDDNDDYNKHRFYDKTNIFMEDEQQQHLDQSIYSEDRPTSSGGCQDPPNEQSTPDQDTRLVQSHRENDIHYLRVGTNTRSNTYTTTNDKDSYIDPQSNRNINDNNEKELPPLSSDHRIEVGIEAINLDRGDHNKQKGDVKQFKGIPGLTSYHDFLKNTIKEAPKKAPTSKLSATKKNSLSSQQKQFIAKTSMKSTTKASSIEKSSEEKVGHENQASSSRSIENRENGSTDDVKKPTTKKKIIVKKVIKRKKVPLVQEISPELDTV